MLQQVTMQQVNLECKFLHPICVGSKAAYNITASDNICIGTNTRTVTINGYGRSDCIGYGSKLSQSNQVTLGTLSTTVKIVGSMSTGSALLSNQSLGYLSGAKSNIVTNRDYIR